jgi:sarcosine oxidase gamma subunit
VTASEPAGTGSTVLDAFGVHVEVRVAGARADEVLARLADLWEHCRTPPGARAEIHVDALLDDDTATWQEAEASGVVARPELADLLQVLTQRVTESAVDARAGECVMLHAACLADPATGRAVAFVAPGGTGKTTLVRTLGPGRWYVTDETTVVLEDGTVVPYPKPLSVRRAPGSLFKDETAPSRAGLVAPAGRVHLAGLCLLVRDDDHEGPAVVETLGTLDGVVSLVPQTSHLTDLPRPLRRLAELSESVGGVHRVHYREARDLEALWGRLLGAPS